MFAELVGFVTMVAAEILLFHHCYLVEIISIVPIVVSVYTADIEIMVSWIMLLGTQPFRAVLGAVKGLKGGNSVQFAEKYGHLHGKENGSNATFASFGSIMIAIKI